MKRPLLVVTIAYIIGIIIGVYLQISIPFVFVGIIILILSAILIKNIDFTKLLKSKKERTVVAKISKKFAVIILTTVLISLARVRYLNNKYEKIYRLDEKMCKLLEQFVTK